MVLKSTKLQLFEVTKYVNNFLLLAFQVLRLILQKFNSKTRRTLEILILNNMYCVV